MPGEMNLKPCPLCGGESWHAYREKLVGCDACDVWVGYGGAHEAREFEQAVEVWNRRAPDPETKMLSNDDLAQDMAECIFTCNWERIDELKSYIVSFLNEVESKKSVTSVIRWTRYDGTPETLPKGRILVQRQEVGFTKEALEFEVYFDNDKPCWKKGMTFWHMEIGDLWAYLPEPPEGME